MPRIYSCNISHVAVVRLWPCLEIDRVSELARLQEIYFLKYPLLKKVYPLFYCIDISVI